jgi:uroporphyrinogen III methyltransferase/synthase
MGVGNLSRITNSLVEHGMSPETPAALIRWGSLPEQETLVSTVGKIAAEAKEAGLRPPAVGVIGKVVELRSQLQWFEKRPLYNRRIAVTRPAGQQEQITAVLREFGADVLFSPTIQLEPHPLDDFFHGAIEEIETGKFDWILFSSANAVQIFIQRLIESRRDVRLLHVLQIASVGARTSDALLKAGLRADITATDSRQEGVVEAMAELHVERVLMPQAAQARDEFTQAMSNRKIATVQLPMYDIVPNPAGVERLIEHLRRKRIDMICFTSALTFTSLVEALSPEEIQELLAPVALAAIGPITSDAIRRAGLNPALQASSASAEALAAAMVEFFVKNPDFRIPKP